MKRGKTSSDFSKRILFCALCTLSGAGVMASPLNGTLSDADIVQVRNNQWCDYRY